MRLYSKNQVIGIVLVAAALASGFTLLISSRDSDTAAVNSEASLETPELVLQTGTMYGNDEFALSTLDVASSDGYTQDEQQNISVYERANEAVVNITTETVGINWFLEPVPQEGVRIACSRI